MCLTAADQLHKLWSVAQSVIKNYVADTVTDPEKLKIHS